jgi:peptidoglycan/xylan/chitin deacetylase (PgdA/CDA1 family)
VVIKTNVLNTVPEPAPVVLPAEPVKEPEPAPAVEPSAPVNGPKIVDKIDLSQFEKKAAKPKEEPAPAPVEEPAPGQAEISAAPVQAEEVKAVIRKPLGKRVSSVPMKGKYVALTFDDGPHPSLTARALDILRRHGAKGTFFMLGQNAARYKSLVARAAAEGHELGVHTWTHIKMNSSSRAKVDSEIDRTQKILAEVSGVRPRVMRPPYGATNKSLVDHMYNRYGMASIMWDVDTLDWRRPGVNKVINVAVNKARPGSIILVHDIHESTLAALEGIVTGLQARGFKLVTVSELMQIGKREAAEPKEVKEPEQPAPAVDMPQPESPVTDMPLVQQTQPEPTPEPVSEPVAEPVSPVAQPETQVDSNAEQPQGDPHAAGDTAPAVNLDASAPNMM